MSTDTKTSTTDVPSEEKPTTDKPVAKKPEEKPVELPAFEKGISDKIKHLHTWYKFKMVMA
jgi:hypothetical protein